jgi:hypothetical protein
MLSDNLKLFILFIVFLVGAYVTGKATVGREGFEDISANQDAIVNGGSGSGSGSKDLNPLRSRCPNLLIQKGTTLYLHNTNLAPVPGVNPIRFDNLEEYIEFIEWLRGQGIKCPILFLQHSVNAQGESVYNIRPSPTDLRGGLCPSTGHVAGGIDADNVDSELNHDDGMGPGDGAFRLHSINAKASAASSRYDTVVSPQQISEITKLIDQAGENDPYAVSKYPNVFGKGGDATVIRPADRESMLKIQASYLNQQNSG